MAFQYQFRACPVMALRSLSNLFGERGEKVLECCWRQAVQATSPLCLGSFCAGHWCLGMTMPGPLSRDRGPGGGRRAQAATKGASGRPVVSHQKDSPWCQPPEVEATAVDRIAAPGASRPQRSLVGTPGRPQPGGLP